MSYPILPSLPGIAWSRKKSPMFSTTVSASVSGREVRSANYARSLYQYEIVYEALTSLGGKQYAALQPYSLQTLLGFFNQAKGQLNPWVYVDDSDSVAENVVFATADGVTSQWPLLRNFGPTVNVLEAAPYVVSLGAVTGAYGSAPIPITGCTITAPNLINFPTPPSAGTVLAASFTFGLICRFLDDTLEFEEVWKGVWSVSSVKFRSIR